MTAPREFKIKAKNQVWKQFRFALSANLGLGSYTLFELTVMSDRPCFDLIGNLLDDDEDKNETTIETAREEAIKFIASTKSSRTKEITEQDVRKFKHFLLHEGQSKDPHELDAPLLSAYLCRYIQQLKRSDGEEYEPQTLKGIIYSIERHLKEQSYPDFKISTSSSFSLVQDVLKAKMAVSKSSGKGNRPNRAMPVSEEDERKFWESKAFGFHHPMALLRVLFWYFTMLFGLRGRNEHHQMLWGDVELKCGADGEYLEYSERLTKTRRGCDSGRAFKPKIFSLEDKTKCPVEAFKLYSSKRPASSDSCSKFYLAVNYTFEKTGNWFKNAPLGANSIGGLLSSAAKMAEITDKKIVNHSARKTAIKRLLDGGCPESYVTQLTGHKSVNSLTSYSEACDTVQRKMARTVTENADFSSDKHRQDHKASVAEVSSDVQSGASFTVTSTADLASISRGAVVGTEFHSCTFNIHFNMTSKESV